MRIGIFDPYLDSLSGGEKYISSIASCLASNHHEVFIFWNKDQESKIKKQANEMLGVSLSTVGFTENIFDKRISFVSRIINTMKYDIIFYVSDGSIPLLFSKKNFLIFQFPVQWVNGKNIITQLKLRNIHKIICYSKFVKQFLDKTFMTDSFVLNPPVTQVGGALKKHKKNVILTVGRFTKAINRKKQEDLLITFKRMYIDGLFGWKFILIGSVLPKDEALFWELRSKSKGYPIEILKNVSFYELKKYYQMARIYWHAAGYGEDLQEHPEKAEHFGISTAEAMSAGAVPVVINAGGQKEIVDNGKNGFLWNTLDELVDKTNLLIKDSRLWAKMSEDAKKRSKMFNGERFCRGLEEIIRQ